MPFQPWASPDPQSVAGLNSAMVYGENIQVAAGVNHQVALGSNVQICVNPGVLFDLLEVPGSSTLSSLWGTGLGGNIQFTIGSNTSVTWGRQFQVTLGPEQITVDANNHKAFAKAMCVLIGAACLAYAIAYGLITDENDRATAVIVYQTTMDLLLAAFMTQMMFYKGTEATLSDGLRSLFQAPEVDHSQTLEGFANALSFIGVMAAAVIPPVILATEEGHFQGETQDSSS